MQTKKYVIFVIGPLVSIVFNYVINVLKNLHVMSVTTVILTMLMFVRSARNSK